MSWRSILAIVLCLGWSALAAEPAAKSAKVPKTKWFQNGKGYQEALELQKQTGADVLVYFAKYSPADQKGLCTWFEKKGLQHPDVQAVVDDYIKVKFTFPLGKDDQALADKWKINKCPVVIVVQTNGWHARASVFDWPAGEPKLKQPDGIVQEILDASAAKSRSHKRAATEDKEGGEKKPE